MTAAVIEDLERVRMLAPGPELAALLAGIDDRHLEHKDRLEVIAAWSRLRSWAEARELRATALVAGPPDEERPVAAALLGSRLHLPHQTASDRLELAWTLATERSWTLRALHAGRLSLAHARVIVEEVHNLGPVDADMVERSVLYDAPDRTAASLRRTLRSKVLKIDPDAQTRRHLQAVKDRATWIRDLGDGMAEFGARLPTADALRCAKVVDTRARELRTAGDERTADQRRADAYTDLMTGGQAPTLELTIRASDDQPVTVPGFGPLDAETLRDLMNAATVVLRPIGLAPTWVSTYPALSSLGRLGPRLRRDLPLPALHHPSPRLRRGHVIPWHQGGRPPPATSCPYAGTSPAQDLPPLEAGAAPRPVSDLDRPHRPEALGSPAGQLTSGAVRRADE